MPRPNPPRSIAGERSLARRIGHERERRAMTYEGLAARMTKAGCPIQASALYKIEKSDPPRRITVDELVAFSEVFATPVQDLLLPPEVVAKEELVARLVEWDAARGEAATARERGDVAWTALRSYVSDHPEVEPTLESAMSGSAERYEQDVQAEAVAYWMWKVTDSDKWRDRFRSALEAD